MSILYVIPVIVGLIIILILIFGLPRKKSERIPSIEGLDNPEVAKAFERMTEILPFKLLRRKVISQLKRLNPSGRLIDLGCGSGNLIVQIAESFPDLDLIGIDISSEILELAQKRAIRNKLDNQLVFKKGNAENLPFSDNSVDFVISTLSLHHRVNPINVFKEMNRVLKPNGTFLLFDFRRNSRKFFYGLLKFATKVVVPKALKKINEPLGSLQAGYISNEIVEIISPIPFQNVDIKPFLAWMFIIVKKS